MAAGMLLALLPTAIILTGLAVCLRRFFRRPGPVWFLLLGIPLASFAALVYLNLKVPYANLVKAFYCLIALLPICVFGSVGWDVLYRHARGFRPVLCVVFGVWALNAYASYWIRGETYATHYVRGYDYSQNNRYEDAIKEFSAALKLEPDDAQACFNIGNVLAKQGKLAAAIGYFERALQLQPDFAKAHCNLGNALTAAGKPAEAIEHFERALQLQPDDAGTLNNLAWLLAAGSEDRLRNGTEAVRLADRACELTQYQEPMFIATLAVAYAEAGRFDDAVTTAQKASTLAGRQGETNLQQQTQGLLQLFRAHTPYRQTR